MSPSQHHQTLKGKITYWVAGCLQCFDTVGWRQEGHPACKKVGGWWRWALISPDGVAPSRMVGVSASVNLPLHHKVQKFSSLLAPAHPGGPGKRVIKWLWLWCGGCSETEPFADKWHRFFAGWMPFISPCQHHHSTEGNSKVLTLARKDHFPGLQFPCQ